MNDRAARPERRLDRRIPLGGTASLRVRDGGTVPAHCVELGVGGMTLHTAYVPGEAEVFEVEVVTPAGGLVRPPLVARVEVRRCHALGGGRYEIGAAIVGVVR